MNDVNMLDNKMISKLTKRYSIQTLFAVAVMSLVVILIKTFAHVDTLVYPLVVSVVFTLVIEFADNEEKAKIYMADDGQTYYIGDYATPDELFIAMMKEIEYELKTS